MSKQVLVVRKDLNMRKGKIAAQCAHASLKVFLDSSQIYVDEDNTSMEFTFSTSNSHVVHWLTDNFKKITVYVNSEQELLEVYKQAKSKNLMCSLILDSGLTEFGGVPTYTVVAIGPDADEAIDSITGKLPLL